MNNYEKIYYENFRKKYAYEKSISLIKKVVEIIGVCDTKEKVYLLKSTTRIATEIALASGSVLSDDTRDFHYKLTIRQAYELSKLINEMQCQEFEECTQIIDEIVKLTRTYRKKLRLKENNEVKKVDVGDKLDLNNIEKIIESIDGFRELKAYKIMIEFYKKIFDILKELPCYEQYSIFSQVQRASESIIANLAEGKARGVLYPKVEANFYTISFGSAVEVSAWLDIMQIKEYISEDEYTELECMLQEIKKLLISYIKRLV